MRFVTVPILVLAVALGVAPASRAQTSDAPETVVPAAQSAEAGGFAPLVASEITLEQFLWTNRPVLVFADTPADPQFQRQMRLLEEGWDELAERDVVVITDTDPAAESDVRTELRPRGFSLVWVDKDGEVRQRKPLPWSVRELVHAIDKTPLRRQEMLDERSGR